MSYKILQQLVDRRYPICVCTIFLRQTITEEQHEEIGPLWGYVMDPYWELESYYVLTFAEGEDPHCLLEYLERHKMKYSLEVILTQHEDLL